MGLDDLLRREKRKDYINKKEIEREIKREATQKIHPSERYKEHTFAQYYYWAPDKNEKTVKALLLLSEHDYGAYGAGSINGLDLYRCKSFLGTYYTIVISHNEGHSSGSIKSDYKKISFGDGVAEIIELKYSDFDSLIKNFQWTIDSEDCPLTQNEIDTLKNIVERYKGVR